MWSENKNDRERDFFNRRVQAHGPSVLSRFYSCHSAHRVYFERAVAGCRGKNALEYGCGIGHAALRLAKAGARVAGIDISDGSIAEARRRAADQGFTIDFRVGDAERTPFADASFDIVCGSGVLHHLRIPAALDEVARLLKREGRAVFIEPLGHNPVVNAFRKLTPSMRTVDERPLSTADLKWFTARFEDVRTSFYDLFSIFAIPLLRSSSGMALFRFLERIDALVFDWLPAARPHAGFLVIEATGPSRRVGG